MKKFTAWFLTFCIVFSLVSVSADNERLMGGLGKIYTSYDADLTLSIKLNKPLEVLNAIDMSYLEDYIDYKSMVESIFGTSSTANIKLNMSSDFKKIKVSVVSETLCPVTINENLKSTVWAKLGYWLELDFSDLANPVYKLTYLTPVYRKYIVIDLSGALTEDAETLKALGSVFEKENLEQIQSEMMKVFFDNAEISNSEGGRYIVKFSDKTFKKYFNDAMVIMLEFMKDKDMVPEADYEETAGSIIMVQDAINSINILGNEGIVYEISLDLMGNIKTTDVKAHICINVYDIMTAFGQETGNITKENSDVDFTVTQNINYKNVNQTVLMDFPQITEDNSMKIEPDKYNNYQQYEDYAYDDYEYDRYQYLYVYDESGHIPVLNADKVYVPLRLFLYELGVLNEEIIWDNGEIIINSQNCPKIHIAQNLKLIKTNDTDEVYTNDGLVIIDGNTYLDKELVTQIFGYKLDSFSTGFYGGSWSASYDFIRQD